MPLLTKLSALVLIYPVLCAKFQARFRRGEPSELDRDGLFKMDWVKQSPPGTHPLMARVGSADNCDSWVGNGMSCYIEAPEHALVHRWVPANATVMEFGSRFGTTTCELAKKLENSGRLVTVEPDSVVWGWLESNLKSHNCHAHVLRGAVSGSPLQMLGSGYGGRSAVADTNLRKGGAAPVGSVPTFTFDQVQKATGLVFDTLLIDCEGCAQDMMDQIGPKIQSQINLIVIEADMPAGVGGDCTKHCMDYQKFFKFLNENGFEQVDMFNDCNHARSGAPADTWCGPWINHYAFKRRTATNTKPISTGKRAGSVFQWKHQPLLPFK